MTRIKLCGLQSLNDVTAANGVQPDYIGFVFAKTSKRFVTPQTAEELRKKLDRKIAVVGVFVNEPVEIVAALLNKGIIDMAQLHGNESEEYITLLRKKTDKKLIKAFSVNEAKKLQAAYSCSADYILLDSGSGGTGKIFDWNLLQDFDRPYFLAGGLNITNVSEAVSRLHPYAVDVSSGIETDGRKDDIKMAAFVNAVRNRM